ncbi:MAG: transcriptional regulator, partial [Verrucomicrobiales bacterium]|nr:transcriptional regulator [Verrucomicrobiales bacterium]
MVRYTQDELAKLLSDAESDLVERKESWRGDAPEKARQAVCAFANDLPDHRKPGLLLVGIRDSGVPAGIQITDELLQTLAAIKSDGKIVPPPTILVEKQRVNDCEVAVVTVHPADSPPVRYDGRIWVRLGPRRGIASAQDERILSEKRRFRDIPFDSHPISAASLGALSKVLFEEEYLPNAFAPDILEANDRTYEQRLAACKLVARADEPIPTVAGLLAIGKHPREWLPGAYIQFLRIDGADWSDPVVDEALIEGPLPQSIRRIDEKFESHNRTSVDIVSGSIESRSTAYPVSALQQLIRNAVMHRTNEGSNAPVRAYWFKDRIEIHSPGGPNGSVTSEKFGQPGVT